MVEADKPLLKEIAANSVTGTQLSAAGAKPSSRPPARVRQVEEPDLRRPGDRR